MAESTQPRARLRAGLLADRAPVPAGSADARALAAVADEQGLTGWLAARAPLEAGWPEAVLQGLRAAQRTLLARALRQLDRAAGVQERLLERGLRLLPLKGAALSERLYADPSERVLGDVDLLALDDWNESLAVLGELGFEPRERADHAWALHDPLTETVFELHHSVTSCPGLFSLDRDGLWARRRAGEGFLKHLPGDEDLLVQLALHAAFQHGLVLTLGQYLDFRRLFERCPPPAEPAWERARQAGAERALLAALQVASALVGAAPPEGLRAPLEKARAGRGGAWLRRLGQAPLRHCPPEIPPLLRRRLEVSHGRRLAFLRGSLAGGPAPRSFSGRLGRLARLARSFFPPSARPGPAEKRTAV